MIALPLLIALEGVEVYGVWAMLGIFVNLAFALELGISRAIVHLLPRQVAGPQELLAAALLVVASILAIAVGVLVALSALDVPFFDLPGHLDDETKHSLIAAGT